ncbi:MAG: thioredoxin [Bacteroidaceae bacterium]|nr:thioredoxin [Bacteroidaceae bacterium]
MKRTIVILLTTLLAFPLFAQENKQEEPVIVMDELMFRTRVFDYKNNDAQEWKYKGDKPCIIDFYATWCAPCRMIAPSLKELAKEYKDSIYVYKVDVDKEKELAAAMGIQSMPTIVFIPQKGQPQVIIGAADKNTFRRAIKEVLLSNE